MYGRQAGLQAHGPLLAASEGPGRASQGFTRAHPCQPLPRPCAWPAQPAATPPPSTPCASTGPPFHRSRPRHPARPARPFLPQPEVGPGAARPLSSTSPPPSTPWWLSRCAPWLTAWPAAARPAATRQAPRTRAASALPTSCTAGRRPEPPRRLPCSYRPAPRRRRPAPGRPRQRATRSQARTPAMEARSPPATPPPRQAAMRPAQPAMGRGCWLLCGQRSRLRGGAGGLRSGL
jgi:hypothetical protein